MAGSRVRAILEIPQYFCGVSIVGGIIEGSGVQAIITVVVDFLKKCFVRTQPALLVSVRPQVGKSQWKSACRRVNERNDKA